MMQRRTLRRSAIALLALVVVGVHLQLADQALQDQLGSGAGDTRLRRIEVTFVRELAPAAPAATAPVPVPVRRSAAAPAPTAAASAPVAGPAEPPLAVAAAPEPVANTVEPFVEPAPAAPAPDIAAPSAPSAASVPAAGDAAAFEWPPSTRLSYTLTGNYRGPVEGQARVEWLRTGARYQVHLDVSVGPSFAPLLARRMSSDGELTAEGLRPLRYDEETKVALRSPRLVSIDFGDETLRLPAGTELPRPAGVQDSASQFGQLTWLFTTQPALLEPGRSVALPLALPRRVDLWTYDVLERETLMTPAGPIEAVHVKPRRGAPAGGELTAEMWIAPSLQYLPVRIVIRQDENTWVDLLLQRLPQQGQAAQPAGR